MMVGIDTYIRKHMIMIRLLGHSKFASFCMAPSKVNAESVHMLGSDCFVVITATRDVAVDDRIVLYGAGTNRYVIESRVGLLNFNLNYLLIS